MSQHERLGKEKERITVCTLLSHAFQKEISMGMRVPAGYRPPPKKKPFHRESFFLEGIQQSMLFPSSINLSYKKKDSIY